MYWRFGIITSFANFGIIPDKKSLKGRIYYDPNNINGCKTFGDFDFNWQDKTEKIVPPIIIVKRGDCSFVTKIRNIQRAGGMAGIVFDDKNDDIRSVIMSDDGSGSEIRIPSMLIGKEDGRLLISFMNEYGSTPSVSHSNFNHEDIDTDDTSKNQTYRVAPKYSKEIE